MATRAPTRHPSPTRNERGPNAARPPVRDFAGGSSFVVEWDVRPVFDFMFSLSAEAGATDDLPPEDRRWLTETKAALPADIWADIEVLNETEMAIQVASFAVAHPELRTVDGLLAALEATPPADLILAMLGDLEKRPGSEAVTKAAVDGDKDALARLARGAGEHCDTLMRLLADPVETHHRILSVLRAWAVPFKAIEDRIAAIGERDFAGRAEDRTTLDPLDLIERTTGGVRWLPSAGIHRVILGPSYFSRPYNFLLGGNGWRFFGYPVADEALDEGNPLDPPPSMIRLHRALGDPTRMRILKLLDGRDLYATEIAQQLGLSKPTITHHLALLRAAGLVTITEAGTIVYYTLRHDRLGDVSTDLKRFLGA